MVRNVFEVNLPASSFEKDFEYFIAIMADEIP